MTRLKMLATRRGMAAAALTQKQRRGGGDHRYVVGAMRKLGEHVVLFAVKMGPAYDVPRPPVLTNQASCFCRWRTRQAAHQFMTRWNMADCHVYDLDFLDVLDAQVADAV